MQSCSNYTEMKYVQSYVNEITHLRQISKLWGSLKQTKNYFLPTKNDFCNKNQTIVNLFSEAQHMRFYLYFWQSGSLLGNIKQVSTEKTH